MIEQLTISVEDLGVRLDTLLSRHFPDHSRTYFQNLIENGGVLLNNLPIKKRAKLSLGDELAITFAPTCAIDVRPENIPLEILYEDEHLLAVNKPVSMVVHPAPGSMSGTFANALLHHCQTLNPEEFETNRPGIVHRLDKDTSGVLLAAKTKLAHQKLVEAFAARQVEKTYLGICCGVPKEGIFSAPIQRHPIHRKLMTVSEEGKEAISHFRVLAKKKGLCLVEVGLHTGRTHQIRVHLKALNCPILGDAAYGSRHSNQSYRAERQMLHASRLKLTHPITSIPLEMTAPPPEDMKNFIALIERS